MKKIYKTCAASAIHALLALTVALTGAVGAKAEEPAKTLKILSVGNSYSVDMQTYVHNMAEKAGYDVEVVNAFVGGCSVIKHVNNYNGDIAEYKLYKNSLLLASDQTLKSILDYDTFDFVTLQNGTTGYTDIVPPVEGHVEELIEIVKKHQPNAQIVWNFFWADAGKTTVDDSGVAIRGVLRNVYGGDRMKMLADYTHQAEYCKTVEGIDYINPVSDVFEAAYAEYGGLLSRDGFHLSERGRYLMACEWLEFFLGIEAPEDFIPLGMTYSAEKANTDVPDEETRAHLRGYAHDVLASYEGKPSVTLQKRGDGQALAESRKPSSVLPYFAAAGAAAAVGAAALFVGHKLKKKK